MRYYKIIDENQVIGTITDKNFVSYSPLVDSYVHATDETGEYATYKGLFYRSEWMQPINDNFTMYKTVLILNIDEVEYNALTEALASNEIIEVDWDTVPIDELKPYVDPDTQNTIDFIRSSKIQEMSYECRKTIEAGFDLELQGAIHHFSLTTQDQLNLMSLSTLAQTQTLIPYHADGEECVFYSAEDINKIIETATNLKIYQTTYYNSLKTYINALETIEEIAAIEYGTPIPEEYKSDALKILEM